jgi:putative CocE/NonD family hydrolase
MNRRIIVRIAALVAALVLLSSASMTAQESYDVKAHYTKAEYRIPMRDGVKLFTSVYIPKDASQKYPFLMQRTPYSVGPYGEDKYRGGLGPSPFLMKEGYIFVYQDVRGRWMSEGNFKWMTPYKPHKASATDVDESTDTYDTIEWLLKNVPNNNGRVGMWGISYPGHFVAQAIIDAHPALKAASPQAPMNDNYLGDDIHHGGTFFLPHGFLFLARSDFGRQRSGPGMAQTKPFDTGTLDGYKFFLDMGPLANANAKYLKGASSFWNEWMEHGNYDAYWKPQNIAQNLTHVTPAVLTVGGWFDAEDLPGPLRIYQAVEKNNPRTWNSLVMGPWCHGCWSRRTLENLGDINFGSNTAAYYQENIELPFFNFFLKDKGENKLPEAYVFETGTNQWRQYDQWPPKGSRAASLYLRSGGLLSFEAPKEDGPKDGKDTYDEYVSDPQKPVPYVNEITLGMKYEYMDYDQRFASTRQDVLVYQTPELKDDVTLAGTLEAELFASSSGTDSDFVVKLIDVFPSHGNDRMSGYQMMVRGEPFRAKYRKSYEKPEPLVPNQVTRIPFYLPDINHTFQKGHRIMIQVQSTWFPLMDRNPQKFIDIYKASERDFQKATQRVYRSPKQATRLKVNVLNEPR